MLTVFICAQLLGVQLIRSSDLEQVTDGVILYDSYNSYWIYRSVRVFKFFVKNCNGLTIVDIEFTKTDFILSKIYTNNLDKTLSFFFNFLKLTQLSNPRWSSDIFLCISSGWSWYWNDRLKTTLWKVFKLWLPLMAIIRYGAYYMGHIVWVAFSRKIHPDRFLLFLTTRPSLIWINRIWC